MTRNDSELLKAYVEAGSEAAFAELVERHIGLVYAAALRQANDASHLAEDISQKVFTSLAGKAFTLTQHTSIAGWLYTSTRYAASDTLRSERRRFTREQESYVMNQLSEGGEPSLKWEELRPVIDEALTDLDEEDREAILLRFFQGCSLAEVGGRLGVKENTARMRVDRALDKLRLGLARRKITSTATAIATSLTGYAMSMAPAGLAMRVSQAALAGSLAAAGGGAASWLTGKVVKSLLALSVAAVITIPLLHHAFASSRLVSQARLAASSNVSNVAPAPNSFAVNGVVQTNQAADAIPLTAPHINIYLDDPKTGKPVSNVLIDEWCWAKGDFKKAQFYSDKNGWCEVAYPANVTLLQLTTRLDGYADTRLEWHTDHGDTVPDTYTVHLAPSVLIGGLVEDAQGKPIADAKVGWNAEDAPLIDSLPENHQFGWIEVSTDADGRWQINCIAADMIRRLYGSAKAAGYLSTPLVNVGGDPHVEAALKAGTYVFKLGDAVTISGTVVNATGEPVADAHVFTGYISSGDKSEVTTDGQGNFTINGCAPGDVLLTAYAPGFANTTEEINTTNNSQSYQIVLTTGGTIKIKIQSPSGAPIPRATAWLDCLNGAPLDSPYNKLKRTQVDYSPTSDNDGIILWTNAPAGILNFQFSAPDYVRSGSFYFKADGQQHVVTLHPALVLIGDVRDADTGQPIPHFRMGIGWPEEDYQTGQTNGHWSSLGRFWPEFSEGVFSNLMEEPVISGMQNPGYILKFEADGYRTYTSRPIGPDEGHVHLDIALKPSHSRVISIISSDGQPEANADVGLVGPGASLELASGGFSKTQSGASLLNSDSSGRIALSDDDTVTHVIVACPDGYADISIADLETNPVINLQAWGRIEGACFSNGQPVAGREYVFQLYSQDKNDPGIRTDFNAFRVISDEQGKFVLPMVPPGKHYLVRLIRINATPPGGMAWMHEKQTEVDVKPGETTPVSIGNSGYQIIARIQWPGGATPTNLINLMFSLHSPMPALPSELAGHPDLIQRYQQSPEFQKMAKSIKRYTMQLNPDGTYEADDVPAGNYVLSCYAMLQPQSGGFAPGMSSPDLPVTIPDDPPTGKIDAGTLQMQHDDEK